MVRMSAERRISDEDLSRLRLLGEEGWSLADLAARFAISPQHVGRLLRGVQRPSIASWDGEAAGVADAVDAFLDEVELGVGDEVLAATARVLAALDAGPRELDEVDHLQARRAARLLAMAASADFDNGNKRGKRE